MTQANEPRPPLTQAEADACTSCEELARLMLDRPPNRVLKEALYKAPLRFSNCYFHEADLAVSLVLYCPDAVKGNQDKREYARAMIHRKLSLSERFLEWFHAHA